MLGWNSKIFRLWQSWILVQLELSNALSLQNPKNLLLVDTFSEMGVLFVLPISSAPWKPEKTQGYSDDSSLLPIQALVACGNQVGSRKLRGCLCTSGASFAEPESL